MRDKKGYLYTDTKRILLKPNIYISVVCVALSLLFSLEEDGLQPQGVAYTYIRSINMTGVLVAYAFCTWSFGLSLYEDLEKKYILYQLSRGDLKKYVVSKTSMIFLSSLLTMVLGSVLFVLACRCQIPWNDEAINGLNAFYYGAFGSLLREKHYFRYCLLCSVFQGMRAGILSLWAAVFSTIISSKIMVLALPILMYQILIAYTGKWYGINIFDIYYVKVFEDDWKMAVMLILICIVMLVSGGTVMYKRLKARL